MFISVYCSEGQKIEEIAFPERQSNMIFVGKERKQETPLKELTKPTGIEFYHLSV